ncbi:MAG TPA: hypothetical protein VG867_08965, partial [Rhizomicrobium sp.]|nr:hypothetical protein [Rhizomicrobium sp.]
AYRGQPLLPDVRDAVLEIGLASVPLLFIPRESDAPAQVRAIIGRSYPLVLLAAVVFAAFAATLGRGIGA